ncbi:hypothetical protein ACFV2X_37610 [Streptomyces sp. NPDC059679]|uniref:hypothetical protein n=1 Tax=Streptomyces sp. NPDC059679 TaxID=3346903 RepID=UPI0036B989C3
MSVAAASIACASGAWLVGDTVVIRGLAATAAAAAVVGAVLMRSWDRSAGRRVAEVASENARQELKYEDRIAELEADAEKAAELQTALNAKLRAKRAELARLRNEHASLLRRYATAETERARALEGRRRLALEAAAPVRELESEPSAPELPAHEASGPGNPVAGAPTAEAYARADEALRHLVRNARRQREERERVPRQPRAEERAEGEPGERADGERADGERAADDRLVEDRPVQDRLVEDQSGEAQSGEDQAAVAASGAGEPRPHARTAASAVVPYAAARRAASRAEGGFDYFGTQKKQPKKREPEPVESAEPAEPAEPAESAESAERPEASDEDLADVIGAETLAEEAGKGAVGEVIDLTEHDEAEHIEMPKLRSAIS